MNSNLSRRIDRIEGLLGDEPRPGNELSPALREAVDRLVRREPPLKGLGETERKGDQPHFQRQPERLSPALQESVDRLLKRVNNAEKVSEDSKGGNDGE